MRKSNGNKGIVIASGVHLIIWAIVMLASIVESFTYNEPTAEPLNFALSRCIYNIFIIISAAGIINVTVLFLSLRGICDKQKRKKITSLCFSVTATIFFYLSAVLVFVIQSDLVIIFPIICLLLELCCGALLPVSGNSNKAIPT